MARRLALSELVHKFIGARTATTTHPDHPRPCPVTSNYRQIFHDDDSFLHIAKQNRLVYLGEIHSKPPIVALQYELQQALASTSTRLHVVLEHFSFEMQPMLDSFCAGELSFEELVRKYHEQGSEGHDLWPYRSVLEHARDSSHKITIHAGFLPRKYARMLMKEGPKVAYEAASMYLPATTSMPVGTEFHYNIFESLITGRKITSTPPSDQVRRIFPAQVLKDVAMGYKVQTLLDGLKDGEKVMVVAGNGHVIHYSGVPERVQFPSDETLLIVSMSADDDLEDKQVVHQRMEDTFGPEGTYPADYVYMYRDLDVKQETREAYDRVGSSAHLEGNAVKAKAIMSALGYTEQQFEQAGSDAHNFQGVGNPHHHANIQVGDKVLDVGSGLGIDSFIASYAAGGDTGRIVGIDLSSKQVQHAQDRANERDLNIKFSVADMENLPFPNESFDVVISNGAFCLAPNKEQAFRELYRVLKPGGRISVCTTTTKEHLEGSTEWPLCMRMFIPLKDIEPTLQTIGFSDIYVDDTDSSMTMELPEEVMEESSNPDRNRVHVGRPEFRHLEKYDMDKLCARVCVVATKPKQQQK